MIRKYPHAILTALAGLLFIPFLGAVHLFDWDEINFAEAAREMLVTGVYHKVQINYEPFWEKPPLFFWLQVGAMKLFGVNEFAARLPNALCGIITLNLIFYYGRKWYSSHLAWWWVLLYAGSFTPHFYFKSGIIDPVFNLFIFLSVVQLYRGSTESSFRNRYFALAGLFMGLAMLTKGPVALIVVGLCGGGYLMANRFRTFFTVYQLMLCAATALLVPLLWFLPDWIQNGLWFTTEFLKYQADLFLHPVASHGQPWYYHTLVLIAGCFPAAILAIPFLFRQPPWGSGGWITWMKILFWVVLILFSAVTTKIVHYSSLCYLPLTFLAAWGLNRNQGQIKNWQWIFIGVMGLLYAAVFTLIPLLGVNSELQKKILPLIADEFARANLLYPTEWSRYTFLAGPLYLVFLAVCIMIYRTGKYKPSVMALLGGNALFLFGISYGIVPKIENHVQGGAVGFYQSLQGKDVYLETIGFKSYAHLFYARKSVPDPHDLLQKELVQYCKTHNLNPDGQLNEAERNELNSVRKKWYLTGTIDKPVYLVYKVHQTEGMDSNRSFRKILSQGGFVVYKRAVN